MNRILEILTRVESENFLEEDEVKLLSSKCEMFRILKVNDFYPDYSNVRVKYDGKFYEGLLVHNNDIIW